MIKYKFSDIFIGFLLVIYPIVSITIKHAANGILFLLCVISLISLFTSKINKQSISNWWGQSSNFKLATWFCAPLIALVFSMLISQFANGNFNAKTFDPILRILLGIPILFFLRKNGKKLQNWILFSFTISALLFWGVEQLHFMDFVIGRLRLSFIDAIHIGNAAIFFSLASLLFSTFRSSILEKAFLILCAALGMYVVYLTQSRGSWVAIPFVIILLVVRFETVKARLAVLVLTASVLTGLSLLPAVQVRIAAGLNDFHSYQTVNKDTSVGVRLQHLHMGYEIFKLNPILGAGAYGARQYADEMIKKGLVTPYAGDFAKAELHNDFLAFLVNYGIVGLVLLLIFFGGIFHLFCIKRNNLDVNIKSASYLGMCAILSDFAFSLTVETWNLTMLTSMFAMHIVALLAVAYHTDI